jgi:L,D-transpeptidase ErfK/SrfK
MIVRGFSKLFSTRPKKAYPAVVRPKKKLIEVTPVGTPVQIIYEPVKIGFLKGRGFIEVHEDIYHKIPSMLEHAVKLIDARQLGTKINWTRLVQAVEEKNGAPLDITR